MPEKPLLKKILHEINSRRILPAVLLYGAGAFTVLEATDILSDRFGWPAVVFKIVFTLIIAGIPIALIIAWYHGEKGKQHVQRIEIILISIISLIAFAIVINLIISVKPPPKPEIVISPPPRDLQTIRSFIHPPEKTSFAYYGIGGSHIALAPNGKMLAFVASDSSGNNAIWIRQLNNLKAEKCPGTEGANFPFWSPDNQFIGFFSEGKMKKVNVSGGPPLTICEVNNGWSASWGVKGKILFATSPPSVVYQVAENGGPPSPVTALDTTRKEWTHLWPQYLPDGEHFFFLADISRGGMGIREGSIFLASVEAYQENSSKNNSCKFLFNSHSNVVFSSGFLLFLKQNTLMAQPFQLTKHQLKGDPVALAEQVQYDNAFGRGGYTVSNNGVLVYQGSSRHVKSHLTLHNRSGSPLEVISQSSLMEDPEISPDDEKIAISQVDESNGNVDIWIHKLDKSASTRFTFSEDFDDDPVWSPDGQRIVFASNGNLYEKPSNGAGRKQLFFQKPEDIVPNDWSSDSLHIIYTYRTGINRNLWFLPVTGERNPFPLSASKYTELHGQFSPDHRWIAYATNETGRYEIFVRNFPLAGGKWQISTDGGVMPRWTKDGTELVYLAPNGMIMSVKVDGSADIFASEVPKALFQTYIKFLTDPKHAYDLTNDGNTFLINHVENEKNMALTLIVNWPTELNQ